jgi:2-oxoglutarate ferredoxin oxidoreductase subunit beta
MNQLTYRDYLVESRLPTIWCPGCGNGIVLKAILKAFADLGLDRKKTVAVSGIGCWGWADDYIDTNAFHGTHGRALAFATGIKLANPELTVVVLMGDGDGATIGGNHLIHAARRNVDLTAVVVNNFNYGMTGGQYSGTTPLGSITSTSLLGHVEDGFDLCALAAASGAPFTARGSVADGEDLRTLIRTGLSRKGFSFVEAVSACTTHYGKRNGIKTPTEMFQWIRKNSVSRERAATLPEEKVRGKFVLGVFSDRQSEDYGTRYRKAAEAAVKEAQA